MNFDQRYQALNEDQKRAVDQTEGSLVVVAGPGSGKTELLGVRTANIIRKSEVPASSILCLTFTNAAAINMRERLFSLIGKDAFKVPIYTFHSFCLEIIESYPEFFFRGVDYTLADQALKLEIIEGILDQLESDDPLKKYHPEGGYVYLKDIERSIYLLQDGGVIPEEFKNIIGKNRQELTDVDKIVEELLGDRVSKKTIEKINSFFEKKEAFKEEDEQLLPLSFVVEKSLLAAALSGETSAISEWKRKMTRRVDGRLVFRDTTQIEKLESLSHVYSLYSEKMKEGAYYTFADMILEVVAVLSKNSDLRKELQERYLYFQVDEFQDTSGVQLKLLKLLSKNEIDEDPNVCVVGDDDQAIYRFQGADISNILDFRRYYPKSKMVVLLKNYRSIQRVIDTSRGVIKLASERLENNFPEINKELISQSKINKGEVYSYNFKTKEEELFFVAKKVKSKIEEGVCPEDIAVITRTHNEIKDALEYFNLLEIPSFAERKEDIFEKEEVLQIINLLKFSLFLLKKEDEGIESLLPEILAYPFFEIKREVIWSVAKTAKEKNISWMSAMMDNKKTSDIGSFLIELSSLAKISSAEDVIDTIIGNKKCGKHLSNFKNFYFNEKVKKNKNKEYFLLLSSLRAFIKIVKTHQRKKTIKVEDVIDLVNFYQKNNINIIDKNPLVTESSSVSLITAHSAKGREFKVVFIINCSQENWGREKVAGKIIFPLNLPLEKAGSKKDDQIRLFYVATTRAKEELYITKHSAKSDGRVIGDLEFVAHLEKWEKKEDVPENVATLNLNRGGILPFLDDEKKLIKPLIDNYILSATGLIKYLNVATGGPQNFFEDSLLRFPQKKTKMLSYGTVVHNLINETYIIFKKEGRILSKTEFLKLFEELLKKEHLAKNDFLEIKKRGEKDLSLYYLNKVKDFKESDIIEKNFKGQECRVGDIQITGKVDKIVLDGNEVDVFDYKTGSPILTMSEKEEYKKIKIWQYKVQIIFYKLLIESSQEFVGRTVRRGFLDFITPKKGGEFINLEIEIDEGEVERVKKLIGVVRGKINQMDFPPVVGYKKNSLKEILRFEDDLLRGKV